MAKPTVNLPEDQEVELPCSKCAGSTAHAVMASVPIQGGHADSVEWEQRYEIVQCRGCKEISFRRAGTNSEDYDYGEDGEIYHHETVVVYPSRVLGRKDLGDDAFHLPSTVRAIYEETVQALANQSPILTGIGVRALIEAVCKEKKAKGANLFKKIDNLVEQKVLTPAGATTLHKIRTLGNSAAHETKPHSEKQLGLAMIVVEHLLRDVYILPKQVAEEFGKEDD